MGEGLGSNPHQHRVPLTPLGWVSLKTGFSCKSEVQKQTLKHTCSCYLYIHTDSISWQLQLPECCVLGVDSGLGIIGCHSAQGDLGSKAQPLSIILLSLQMAGVYSYSEVRFLITSIIYVFTYLEAGHTPWHTCESQVTCKSQRWILGI